MNRRERRRLKVENKRLASKLKASIAAENGPVTVTIEVTPMILGLIDADPVADRIAILAFKSRDDPDPVSTCLCCDGFWADGRVPVLLVRARYGNTTDLVMAGAACHACSKKLGRDGVARFARDYLKLEPRPMAPSTETIQ